MRIRQGDAIGVAKGSDGAEEGIAGYALQHSRIYQQENKIKKSPPHHERGTLTPQTLNLPSNTPPDILAFIISIPTIHS